MSEAAIAIELGPLIPVHRSLRPNWAFAVPELSISGQSDEPLQTACRALIAKGIDPIWPISVRVAGRSDAVWRTTVGLGALSGLAHSGNGTYRLHGSAIDGEATEVSKV